jgi:hypothetical protein
MPEFFGIIKWEFVDEKYFQNPSETSSITFQLVVRVSKGSGRASFAAASIGRSAPAGVFDDAPPPAPGTKKILRGAISAVCTENLIRVDDVKESLKLTE